MTDTTVTSSTSPPRDPSRQAGAPERMSDITLARAIARAVRDVPGVVDLSPGYFALAATYGGAGQRVTGVVVRHLARDAVALEIHVVLSSAPREVSHGSSTSDVESGRAPSGKRAATPASLMSIAGEIRSVVFRTAHDMGTPFLTKVDVLIDDLR